MDTNSSKINSFRFNWGIGIAFFMLLFILWMLSFLVRAFFHQESLVTKDAYEQGLQYQQKIDAVTRTETKTHKIQITRSTNGLEANLAILNVPILIQCKRPDNPTLDFIINLHTDNTGKLTIPTTKFKAGKWNISFEWSEDNQKYYFQQSIFI